MDGVRFDFPLADIRRRRGGIVLLVVAAIAGTAALSGCSGGDQPPEDDPNSNPALDSELREIRLWSDGCDGADPGCAEAWIIYPEVRGDDPLAIAAREWIEDRIAASALMEAGSEESAEEAATAFINAHAEFQAEFPDDALPGWLVERTVEIVRAGPPVLTMSVFETTYTGGAHPNSWIHFRNFDSETGEAWTPARLFQPESDAELRQLLEARFRENAGLAPGTPVTEGGLFEDEIPITENIELDTFGVAFHYNPYAIAPYVVGMIRIHLSWSELDPHLRPDARAMTEGWRRGG